MHDGDHGNLTRETALRPLNVLIIDDDASDRLVLRRLLERHGAPVKITEQTDPLDAIDLSEDDPDVVLLDYFLTGVTGIDCLDQLRLRWPWAAFIVLTGQGDEAIAKQAIQAGATDYLPKRALSETSLWRSIQNGVELAYMQWQLAEQREELSHFAAMLLHDFKAPVRAILFGCETIVEDLAGGDRSAIRNSVDMLEVSAAHLRDLVASVSDHIRLDQEQIDGDIDFQRSFDAATVSLAPEIEASKAAVSCDLDVGTVVGSTAQIAQVLQNLIANALKYSTSPSPAVEVTGRSVGPDRVELVVSDNGPGVAENFREVIFEPFRRGSVASEKRGTGLGLATCRRIVKRHGGHIWCDESALGGAAIHIRLPIDGPESRTLRATLGHRAIGTEVGMGGDRQASKSVD